MVDLQNAVQTVKAGIRAALVLRAPLGGVWDPALLEEMVVGVFLALSDDDVRKAVSLCWPHQEEEERGS